MNGNLELECALCERDVSQEEVRWKGNFPFHPSCLREQILNQRKTT